jgi:HlyD family secretion protein
MSAILETRTDAARAERDAPSATTSAPTPPIAPQPEQAASSVRAPAPLCAPKRKQQHRHRVARLVTGVFVVALAGGIGYAMRPKPMPVEAATVVTGPMQATVEVDAVTRVRDRFAVTAPVGGMVQRLSLLEGDAVRAGDAVATIVTAPVFETERAALVARVDAARAAQLQAESRVTQARLTLAQAMRDHQRARTLLEAGGIAERDEELAALTVTNRRTELGTTEAQRRIADAELVQAHAALAGATAGSGATAVVRAPAAGSVLGMPERSARVVAAGTPLLTLGDPRTLEIAADVLSSDAAKVRRGQAVTLRGWGGAPLRGVVRSIEPSARTRLSALGVEEQRLTVVIDVANAPPALGDGYRLDASIVVWESAKALTVPAGALLRSDGGWDLLAIRDARATRVPVRIGHVGGGVAEVLGGVRAGERVVVLPPDALRPGMRVRSAN